MVTTLALVSVRQQQYDPAPLPPLLLAGGDELVQDRLGAVDEVAELSLPADQGVWPGNRVAVLEADRGELGQQRIVGVELRVAVVELPQRRVLLAGVPVDEAGVALAERAPARAL